MPNSVQNRVFSTMVSCLGLARSRGMGVLEARHDQSKKFSYDSKD
jgi:hypothetical protein